MCRAPTSRGSDRLKHTNRTGKPEHLALRAHADKEYSHSYPAPRGSLVYMMLFQQEHLSPRRVNRRVWAGRGSGELEYRVV